MTSPLPSLLISIPDGVIDLGWGHPSPRLHPAEILATATRSALAQQSVVPLQYGAVQGFGPLLEYLAAYLSGQEAYAGEVRPASLFSPPAPPRPSTSLQPSSLAPAIPSSLRNPPTTSLNKSSLTTDSTSSASPPMPTASTPTPSPICWPPETFPSRACCTPSPLTRTPTAPC